MESHLRLTYLTRNETSRQLSHGNDQDFDYLGEFMKKIEKSLGKPYSLAYIGLTHAKNMTTKISCKRTFNHLNLIVWTGNAVPAVFWIGSSRRIRGRKKYLIPDLDILQCRKLFCKCLSINEYH